MKNHPLLFILTILPVLNGIHAQNGCLPDGISFTSQAQIDSFPINYPGCTVIEGNVQISGLDISNLNGLLAVTLYGGYLNIYNNNLLTNLSGLEALTTVQADLLLTDNPSLASIGALSNLTSVGGSFWIYRNHALTNLSGLENLTAIDDGLVVGSDSLEDISALANLTSLHGGLAIVNNGVLTNLNGLYNVTDFSGDLNISENESLTDLSALENLTPIVYGFFLSGNASLENLHGLDNLTSIKGDLKIRENGSLKSLSALDNVTLIEGELELWGNDSLVNLSGLDHLTNIDGPLVVTQNPVLTSLSGLDNLDHTTISYITITSNPSLTICAVQSVCDYLENETGNVYISGNATGCKSQLEIEAACQAVSAYDVLPGECNIQLFPNPTTGILHIGAPPIAQWDITVRDAMDRIVLPTHDLGERQIDLSALPGGLYFLEVNNGQQSITKRIVKQ